MGAMGLGPPGSRRAQLRLNSSAGLGVRYMERRGTCGKRWCPDWTAQRAYRVACLSVRGSYAHPSPLNVFYNGSTAEWRRRPGRVSDSDRPCHWLGRRSQEDHATFWMIFPSREKSILGSVDREGFGSDYRTHHMWQHG